MPNVVFGTAASVNLVILTPCFFAIALISVDFPAFCAPITQTLLRGPAESFMYEIRFLTARSLWTLIKKTASSFGAPKALARPRTHLSNRTPICCHGSKSTFVPTRTSLGVSLTLEFLLPSSALNNDLTARLGNDPSKSAQSTTMMITGVLADRFISRDEMNLSKSKSGIKFSALSFFTSP
ncbi:hypothetical protein PAHAL_6G214500 [Panicum hallii]|uniref:Uncharacterized protein n=1 Tax=Panicum hallii TaxID=206008 RepID=A0A2T8IH24_9POAL|nr:hypothetical protein PAHAL_6G214500 [Panicum hallii]